MEQHGLKIVWISVEEILNEWDSCDGNGDLKHVLEYKKYHDVYPSLLNSIREHGFLCPLMYEYHEVGDEAIKTQWKGFHRTQKTQWDGHHRLAVAIELGYKWIPYVVPREDVDGFKWSWIEWTSVEGVKTEYLHPENPMPLGFSQQLLEV